MQRSNALLVVAIDFGTAYSGFAMQFRHEFDPRDPTKIRVPQTWNGGKQNLMSYKTPTCLLLDDQQQIDSFGFEAEDRYAELCMTGENKTYYYFRRFKMRLQEGEALKKDSQIEDETGKPMSALKVFALSILCLRQKLIELLMDEKDKGIGEDDILWVLTVPAIWDDAAKGFMKEAAKEAGIKEQCLKIALEPEAASLFCQFLSVEKLCDEKKNAFSKARPGTVYMVADLGGGTADITIHEKLAHNKIREIYKASGGPWGGTAVDNAFLQFFISIVGAPVMSRFQREQTYDHLDLLKEFECIKRKQSGDRYTIKLPVSLDTICQDENDETFKEMVAQSLHKDNITFIGDKIRIETSLIENMFRNVTDMIVQHIRDILKNTDVGKKVALVLMVGGFSESPFVQREVRAGIPSNIKVMVPHQAGMAVLNGAVVYGRIPDSIASRILRYSYGVKVERPFQPGVDPDRKKNPANGCCMDVFKPFISEGTSVERGHKIVQSHNTTCAFQQELSLGVYIAKGKVPEFVTDANCRLLGSLKIKVSKPSEKPQDFMVIFRFGSTSLTIIAIEKETQKALITAFALQD